MNRDDLFPYLDQRVTLRLCEGATLFATGVLRWVTESALAVVEDDAGGREFRLIPAHVYGIEDARHACETCGARVNLLFASALCASCYRRWAHEQPPPQESCEDCGTNGAFRSPKTNAWRCAGCHLRADTLSGLGAERRVLEELEKTDAVLGAECRGADEDDERHDWMQVRRSRRRCRRCHRDSFA